eukprot:COSAG05_NODE_4451_length_1509_cov_2.471631_2_plen_96_part_00
MFGFVYLTRFSHFIIHVECAVSEWPKACQAVRLGFRRDGDKEMSQPQTEAMRMRKSIGKTVSTEGEYRKELAEHACRLITLPCDSLWPIRILIST